MPAHILLLTDYARVKNSERIKREFLVKYFPPGILCILEGNYDRVIAEYSELFLWLAWEEKEKKERKREKRERKFFVTCNEGTLPINFHQFKFTLFFKTRTVQLYNV